MHVVIKGQPLAVDDNIWEIVNDDAANNAESTANISEPSAQTEVNGKGSNS